MKIPSVVVSIILILMMVLSSSAVFADARVWTLLDDRSLEASFITTIGADFVLKSATGKQIKIPASEFSEEDRTFVELLRPPELKVDFINQLKTVTFTEGWYGEFGREPEKHGNFGLRIVQTSSGSYRHELSAEYFVIARQLYRSDPKCFLIDRGEVTFTLTKKNKRTFEFMSDNQVRLQNWEYPGNDFLIQFGEIYYASVVVIRDKRGETVKVEASKSWMAENLENLSQLKIGNYFDKKCVRCFPARPKPLVW
ncbi:hypothetical protein [Pontiella agarivorans]|uniref:SLA1 homology domain-containing protein n=1 Tax=Pontiella agarivorans TaxID=3038953 RepID=A0ABU5MY79_9BACT|nr:hypothetical protein [Pontiella agarivorans]MDZ8119128.1 hypothetical protein [Pontiella agarivorans]